MKTALPLLALAIAAAPLAAAPLELLPSGHPVGEVAIDGRPYRFVIDTAATNTALLPSLRAKLPGAASGSLNLTAAAGQVQIETLKLARITADGRTFRDLNSFVLPAGPVDQLGVDGILGADIIARYAMELDLAGKRWSLAETASPAAQRGMYAPVPFKLDMGTPKLTATVDGKAIPAVLDTGASGTVMNWAAAKLLGLTPDDPRVEKVRSLQGVTKDAPPTYRTTVGELRIGAARGANPTLRIADIGVFKMLGMDGGPAMILGIDQFAGRRIVVDHPGGKLYVSATPAERPQRAAR